MKGVCEAWGAVFICVKGIICTYIFLRDRVKVILIAIHAFTLRWYVLQYVYVYSTFFFLPKKLQW